MKPILLATLAVATLVGTSAMANPNHGPAPKDMQHKIDGMFARFDTNGDDFITQDEVRAVRQKMFEKMDRNSNGYLESDEKRLNKHKHRAMRKMHRAERKMDRRQALDTNQDEKISLSEYQAKSSPMFSKLDTNGDGAISAEEHSAAQKQGFARLDINNDGFLDAADKQARHERHMAKRQQHKTLLDTDQDGQTSKSEFIEAMAPLFSRFDQNGDGQITRYEMQNAPKPSRGMGHKP